jgi:hypothetical protein
MPERPDLRHIAASLREALDGLEREALVDVLTYVLNEYVVEGPAPLAAHQVERLEDLAGLSLAALVAALQTRLDTPGLELFRVEGDEVRVHTAGGWVPLQAVRGSREGRPDAPAPTVEGREGPPAGVPPAEWSRHRGTERVGARFIEQPMPTPATGRSAADEAIARGRGDLAGGDRGIVTSPAPRPRGLSISGRPSPTASAPPAQASQPAGPAAPAVPASPAPPASKPDEAGERKPEGKQDDAAIRFSLLELD